MRASVPGWYCGAPYLPREMHVQRLREDGRRLIGELRARQERPELRIDLRDPSGRAVGLGGDVGQKLLEPRHDLLGRVPAQQAEQLDLVVPVELRLAHEGGLVPLEHAHQLRQRHAESREVGAGEPGQTVELRPRQEMHALHGMVVVQRGGDPLAALGDGGADAGLRPGERLHPPFLPPLAEMLERLVVALRHHHVGQRKSESVHEPRVKRHQLRARHVALGDLQLPLHDIRDKDGMRQGVGPPFRRQVAEIPQPAGEQRHRRHAMVAVRDRDKVPEGPRHEVVLLRHEHRGVFVDALPHVTLEDDRIHPQIVGPEELTRAHRLGNHPVRTADRFALDLPEELSDGGHLHRLFAAQTFFHYRLTASIIPQSMFCQLLHSKQNPPLRG